jgi:hypothetical protein
MTTAIAHFPTRMHDETLSSLLIRLSRRHSATAHELCKLIWPDIEFWTRDIDTSISEASLHEISKSTGVPIEELSKSTLRRLSFLHAGETLPQGCIPGILPVGIYHRVRRRFGQQYCPDCFAQNPPYLRRIWRSEFAICCPVHGILLNDCCPSCGEPFIPHRKLALVSLRCHRCGDALCQKSREPVPALAAALSHKILELQQGLSGATQDEMGQVEDLSCADQFSGVEPLDFIDGVRRLCRIAIGKKASDPGRRSLAKSVWQYKRVSQRAQALYVVARWLEGWPRVWVDWVISKGLTRRQLVIGFGPFPDWISSAVLLVPDSGSPLRLNRAKPLTRLSQLRKKFKVRREYREARAELLLRRATMHDRL